jgi:PAS domain S-box-containing protein
VLWRKPVDSLAPKNLQDTFDDHLKTQRQEATLPGEATATEELATAWGSYTSSYPQLLDPSTPIDQRRSLYLSLALPQSRQVRALAQKLIDMNLASILSVPSKAQASAQRARWMMRTLTITAVLLALIFAGLISRIILRPIQTLTNAAGEVERGNLDLSIPVRSSDELGRLAAAFNTMAGQLRSYRQMAQDRLFRTERTTQLAIDSLPDAVLVINPEGTIHLSNQAARALTGLAEGDSIRQSGLHWLPNLFERISDTEHATEFRDYQSIIQLDVDGESRYFLPRSAPISDPARRSLGATVVLADVTGLRRLDETKNSLLSLVSHELKTPITSARMILHLMADRKIGPLTPKQQDLLNVARDDADRLHQIVESLLDMSRIESGRALMDFGPIVATELVRRSIAPLAGMFQECSLKVESGESTLSVWADSIRIGHVFANLLMNSLRYTPPGGQVLISVAERGDMVEFMVRDTGSGVPRQYQHRVFEKFFRVPGQSRGSGSGLGLAIAKDIVEAHGGLIRIESTEGVGTLVAFTLRSTVGAHGRHSSAPSASISDATAVTFSTATPA